MTRATMDSRRPHRARRVAGSTRRLAWLLAMLALQTLAALGPAARAHAGAWIEVCSAAGVKRLPAPPGQSATHDDHCSLCRMADPMAAPPPPQCPAVASAPVGPVAAGADRVAAAGTSLHDAPPRAPPVP
jgi:hypothetical protein